MPTPETTSVIAEASVSTMVSIVAILAITFSTSVSVNAVKGYCPADAAT